MDKKLFLNSNSLKLSTKIELVIKKNFLVIKHKFIPFKHGVSSVTIDNKQIFYNGFYGIAGYEAIMSEHMSWVSQIHKDNGELVILDIGANVGYFALGCSQILSNYKIFCFEPNTVAFETLQKNVGDLENVKLFKVGVSDVEEKQTLYFDKNESAKGSFIKPENPQETEVLETISLDKFLEQNNITQKIFLLKIDVEGFETKVLKGASETLKKTKYIHMELNQNEYNASDVFKILDSLNLNYKLLFIRNFSNNPDDKLENADMVLELL